MKITPKILACLFAGLLSVLPSIARADDSDKAHADDNLYDPIEPVNRGIFWFNDKLDVYLLEPIATQYDKHMPDDVKTGVGNFFSNLRYPQYLLSDIVQLRFEEAAVHTGRFLINSTIGIAGLIDVAKHFGLEKKREDFGLSLARYGVPAGPYIVLPLLGPSNLRDALGTLVDGAVHPFSILTYTDLDDDVVLPIVYGGRTLEFIHARSELLDAIKTAKDSSLDYYLFMQSAYDQHRRGEINEGKAAPGERDVNSLNDEEELQEQGDILAPMSKR